MTAETLSRSLIDTIPLQLGLNRLAEEVRLVQRLPRPAAPSDGVSALFEAELRLGLEAGDTERAYEAAAALWRRTDDLLRCHRAVTRVLADVGAACAEGRCGVARANRMVATAGELLPRLRARSRAGQRGRVVLAVPQGDAHLLGLSSLAHLLQDAGWTPDVVGALAPSDLARAARGATAVLLSVHVPGAPVAALVGALRRAEPGALVAIGGPAAVPAEADLLTSDAGELLAALELRDCPLSAREQDVLRAVADGLTNADAAAMLGIAAATLKTHLDRIFEKTGASGRAAAVAIGLRRGWIV